MTAYEMRISDCSSDVCSSDLAGSAVIEIGPRLDGVRVMRGDVRTAMQTSPGVAIEMLTSGTTGTPKRVPLSRESWGASVGGCTRYESGRSFDDPPPHSRSEERRVGKECISQCRSRWSP